MFNELITYNYEYEQKLKICFIGAGIHSFRNIYPTFQYAPVDLAAICDFDEKKAAAFARQFGAKNYYTDFREMIRVEKPDAVFIVASYHADGRVQATDIALEVLRLGVHVWMEKPTASSLVEVEQLLEARKESGRFVMTGTKKAFFPSIEKVKDIISSPDFGAVSSIYLRYPQSIPKFEDRTDLPKLRSFLDHIFHPASIIQYLMGNIKNISYQWEPVNGASVTNIVFTSGAIGTMHFTAGSSGSSPLERLEVIGSGANVVVDNGVKVKYYRKAKKPRYGRAPSFMVDEQEAPLYWEPEFSLGQIYNKNIFYLGYVQEILHFCQSVLSNKPPEKGTLEDALEILKLFEAYRFNLPGNVITLNE